jgi:glycine cleavage system H protein
MDVPERLRYTSEHEWLAVAADGRARVGITDYAQDALGDIVFLDLRSEVGGKVAAGDPVAEVDSTKSTSEIYAPVAGTVVAVNQAAVDSPELLNTDPYGEGWLFEIEPDDPAAISGLLDAAGYRTLTDG